ncbi:MAG: sister chromatid cohesion protein PDS5 [Bacteroidetes bacterium]|nr:sister chromatid cohesion protein PDS5 [Bacteroidota bacterium]
MTDTNTSMYRSEVIEKAINIEWIINSIISQHYFNRVDMKFLLDFLYDEYCSFALKRRVLLKIVNDFDPKMESHLNRLMNIRNYFAHCNQEIFDAGETLTQESKGKILDPKKPEREIDFEKLHKEFISIETLVSKYLFEIYQRKGGQFDK